MKPLTVPFLRPLRAFPMLFVVLALSVTTLHGNQEKDPAHCSRATPPTDLKAELDAIERERKAIAKEREATERLAKEVLAALRTAEEAKAAETRAQIASLTEELNAFRNLARDREVERAGFAEEQKSLRARWADSEAMANKARAGLAEETVQRKKLEVEVKRLKAKPASVPEIAPVRFSKNDDENAGECARILREVRAVRADFPEARFHLVGHTSSDATSSLNLALSMRRARNLADFLVKEGIPEERITYEGGGEASPVADNNTEEGRTLNRRVEIWVTN